MVLDCNLRDSAGLEQVDVADSPKAGREPRRIRWTVIATLAASLLVVASWNLFSSPDCVATLVSSEDAAWVSDLPTSVGSELPAGELRLISGIAMLRFDSGATMILEAPARLELQTDMRAFLHDGAAILEVPDSAIGFVVATPSGEATDLGTSFAVSVDSANATSEFEVIKGSISVGLPDQDERVLLKDNEAVLVDSSGISEASTAEDLKLADPANATLRIETGGHEATFVRGHSAGPLTFVVIRETKKIAGDGRVLVHAFASHSHPSAVGPTLEFEIREDDR